MRKTKTSPVDKAIKTELPGGTAWNRLFGNGFEGRVFEGSDKMSASLVLHDSRRDRDPAVRRTRERQTMALAHRLAADAIERTGAELWSVYVDHETRIVIEVTKAGEEADRAAALLVSILEGQA